MQSIAFRRSLCLRFCPLVVMLLVASEALAQVRVASLSLSTQQGVSSLAAPRSDWDFANTEFLTIHSQAFSMVINTSLGDHLLLTTGFCYRKDGWGQQVQFTDVTGEFNGNFAKVFWNYERVGVPLELAFLPKGKEGKWEQFAFIGVAPMYLFRVRTDEPHFFPISPPVEIARLIRDATENYKDWGLLASGGIGINRKINSTLAVGLCGRYTRDLFPLLRIAPEVVDKDLFLGSASLQLSLLFLLGRSEVESVN